ncbi:MAG: hypothetical protein ACOYJA_01530 [Christensenellales bacterium]|jgi:hypothetical protein
MMDLKQQIITELDSRLERLRAHQNDAIEITGNPYEELNQALSKVIGAPLVSELEDLRGFICSL